jgi:RNA polymerase sigma factor (sigma-70 family)
MMENKEQFFNTIIDQHKGILVKVARAYCREEEERNDLLQEMMVQIWQSIHKYNDQYKMSTWLYRIALNVAISFYRQHSRRISKYTPMNEQTLQIASEYIATNEQQLKLLEQFIHELREIDKALMLLYLEDKSYAEIAEIVGMSISNVGTKMGRIKDKLKIRFSQITY